MFPMVKGRAFQGQPKNLYPLRWKTMCYLPPLPTNLPARCRRRGRSSSRNAVLPFLGHNLDGEKGEVSHPHPLTERAPGQGVLEEKMSGGSGN